MGPLLHFGLTRILPKMLFSSTRAGLWNRRCVFHSSQRLHRRRRTPTLLPHMTRVPNLLLAMGHQGIRCHRHHYQVRTATATLRLTPTLALCHSSHHLSIVHQALHRTSPSTHRRQRQEAILPRLQHPMVLHPRHRAPARRHLRPRTNNSPALRRRALRNSTTARSTAVNRSCRPPSTDVAVGAPPQAKWAVRIRAARLPTTRRLSASNRVSTAPVLQGDIVRGVGVEDTGEGDGGRILRRGRSLGLIRGRRGIEVHMGE